LASRIPSKKEKRRKRLQALIVIFLVAMLASGLGLSLYLGLPGSKSATQLLQEGEKAFSEGNYRDAAVLYTKAVKQDPNDYRSQLGLGLALFYQGDKNDAVTHLKRALELYPGIPERATLEALIREGESGQ
jgi:tetratricopeptide (TPR) repeat protein